VSTLSVAMASPAVREASPGPRARVQVSSQLDIGFPDLHTLPLPAEAESLAIAVELATPVLHAAPLVNPVVTGALRAQQLLTQPYLHPVHLTGPPVRSLPLRLASRAHRRAAPVAPTRAIPWSIENIEKPDCLSESTPGAPPIISWELPWPAVRIREGQARALMGSIRYPALRRIPDPLRRALERSHGQEYAEAANGWTLDAAFTALPLGAFVRYRYDGWRRVLFAQPRDAALVDDPGWAALGVFRQPDELLPRFVQMPLDEVRRFR